MYTKYHKSTSDKLQSGRLGKLRRCQLVKSSTVHQCML